MIISFMMIGIALFVAVDTSNRLSDLETVVEGLVIDSTKYRMYNVDIQAMRGEIRGLNLRYTDLEREYSTFRNLQLNFDFNRDSTLTRKVFFIK